jgi:hypothetical protein
MKTWDGTNVSVHVRRLAIGVQEHYLVVLSLGDLRAAGFGC